MSLAAFGCNPDLRYSPPARGESLNVGFEPGTIGSSPSGQMCVFVQADGAIDADRLIAIEAGYRARQRTSATIVHGSRLGVATEAFADDEYGWLVVWGEAQVNAAADVSAGNALNLHASSAGDVQPATANTPEILGIHATTAVDVSAQADDRITATLAFPVNRA